MTLSPGILKKRGKPSNVICVLWGFVSAEHTGEQNMRTIVILGMTVLHSLATTTPSVDLFLKHAWVDTEFIGVHWFREDSDSRIVSFNRLPDIPAGVVPTR